MPLPSDHVHPAIQPPVYPLCRSAFTLALTTGHGRALIRADYFDVDDFRDEFFEAATVCKVYDTADDGYREWWRSCYTPHRGL